MKTSTYLSMLIGWLIGGVISYYSFDMDFKFTIGGAVMFTLAYFITKK